MNRVFIKTYGCQMNERDSEAVAAMLRNRGYSIVSIESEADIVLINTCSIRDQAEQKALGKAGQLSKLKRQKPNLILGIMGCMAQNRGSSLLDRLPDLDLIVGTQKFHRVPDHLENLIISLQAQGPRPTTIVDLEEEEGSQNTIRDHISSERKVSAFVSIMQGCNMNCTYCIVPMTRGQERSRPIEDIVEEITELAANGTREITLLGQIVTSYGRRDISFKKGLSPFVQLLHAIHEIKGIERIRFTSPHPRGFKQDLIESYRELPKLCEYVHLPLQSGSDTILKTMKRPYTTDRYRRIVEDLRSIVPNMYFSTDIIVGFPGETETDFEATRQIFEDLRFDSAFIFKYSERPGTESALNLKDNIPFEIKEERNQILLKILENFALARHESLVGAIEEVLVERPARRGEEMYVGRNRGYRKIVFPGRNRLIGELVQIKIERATVSTLYGTLQLKGIEEENAFVTKSFSIPIHLPSKLISESDCCSNNISCCNS